MKFTQFLMVYAIGCMVATAVGLYINDRFFIILHKKEWDCVAYEQKRCIKYQRRPW